MVNRQVRQYYIDKENADHSITDRLIQGGYKQPAGGYILNAKRAGGKRSFTVLAFDIFVERTL